MLSDRDFTRRMVQMVITVALVAVVLWSLWIARNALLLIYISGLVAMGFSPLVRDIEHRRAGALHLRQSACAIVRLGDHFKARFRRDHLSQTLPEQRMIINDHGTNGTIHE